MMKTEKMLKIANELNRCFAYSDINGSVQFYKHEDNSINVCFTHIDSRYPHNNKSIFIYDWLDDKKINTLVDKAKKVIAGEALLNE